MSSHPLESDDEGTSKKITKKQLKLLVAINDSEAVLFDSIRQEYARLEGGKPLNEEKFVQVFRKYNPHFVQMLTTDATDDSDDSDDDEEALPLKYVSFMKAFASSRDNFTLAIKTNYKKIYHKELKEVDFSIFRTHPEEIFKRKQNDETNEAPPPGNWNVKSADGQSDCLADKVAGISLGVVDDCVIATNPNDVTQETNESLLSAQEAELRGIESESDTPTPTKEDWSQVNSPKNHDETLTDQMNEEREEEWCGENAMMGKAKPLMVPPRAEMIEEKCDEKTPLPNHEKVLLESISSPTVENSECAVEECAVNGTESMNEEVLPPPEHVPSLISNGESNWNDVEDAVKEELDEEEEEEVTIDSLIADEMVKRVNEQVKEKVKEVHQDIRFYLPFCIERLVREYEQGGRRGLTIGDFIGPEFTCPTLEIFLDNLLRKDRSLREIICPRRIDYEEAMIHLRMLTSDEGLSRYENERKEVEKEAMKRMEEMKGEEKDEIRKIEEMKMNMMRGESEEEKMLESVDTIDLQFPLSEIPMSVKDSISFLRVESEEGRMEITLMVPYLEQLLKDTLREMRQLDMSPLCLSEATELEKGRVVVVKSSDGEYHRAFIDEDWRRDEGKTLLWCHLFDYGSHYEISIDAIYRFPKMKKEVPSTLLSCRIDAVPIGARDDHESFTMDAWTEIVHEMRRGWISEKAEVVVKRYDGFKFCIDIMDEEGESLIDHLVTMNLLQKIPSLPTPPPPTPPPLLPPSSITQSTTSPSLLSIPLRPSLLIPSPPSISITTPSVSIPDPSDGPIIMPAPTAMFIPSRPQGFSNGYVRPVSIHPIHSTPNPSMEDAPVFGTRSAPVPDNFLEVRDVPSMLNIVGGGGRCDNTTISNVKNTERRRGLVQIVDDESPC